MVCRFPAALVLISVLAGPALAEEPVPATTRCGGVLCDLYYANKPAPAPGQPDVPDPTRLPCRDFICGMFGGRTVEAPPPLEQPVVAGMAPEPAKKTAHHKHKAPKTVAAAEPKAETAK